MYEFKLTRRQNRIVTREVFTFKWSVTANRKRKIYHETKNGKTYIKLPIRSKETIDKETLLASRPFSKYHYDLINSAYSKEDRSLKLAAERAKHEERIKKMRERLIAYKSSLKLRNPKNALYKIVSYYEDNSQKVRVLTEEYVSSLTLEGISEKMKETNALLSKYRSYHHMSLKDKDGKVLILYTSVPLTLGYAA